MTSKKRAELRAAANKIEPVFQTGKGGMSDALIAQTDDALRARELIKLKVLLETTPEPPKVLAQKIADATGSEVVQVIGGSIVLFRENPELHQVKKPVKKLVKKTTKPHRNSAVKPGIARAGRPAVQGVKYSERKTTGKTTIKSGRTPVKRADNTNAGYKPQHKGRTNTAAKQAGTGGFARKVK